MERDRDLPGCESAAAAVQPAQTNGAFISIYPSFSLQSVCQYVSVQVGLPSIEIITMIASPKTAAVQPPMLKYSQFCSRLSVSQSVRLNKKRSLGSLSFSQYSSFLILGKSKAISVKPFSIDLNSCTQTLVIILNENASH